MRTEQRVTATYPDRIETYVGPLELSGARARVHREAGAAVTVEERTVSDWQPVEGGDG